MVEDARIADSPLRPEPVLEIRALPQRAHSDAPAAGGGAADMTRAASWSLPYRGPSRAAGSPRIFEAECAWLMTVANQKTVGGFLHIAWRTAGDIAHRVAERLGTVMPSPFDGLTAIGVDETSYRKGHTYITVVVDHERHRVIWAHDGVGRDVFGLFFQALTPEQRASIRLVTGDGARWIDSCVGRWCPNVKRVLDGFHIVSWMSDALDKVRKNACGTRHAAAATRRPRSACAASSTPY